MRAACALRSLEQDAPDPDVTLVPDCSPLETMYRLIKRRMALRSLPFGVPLWVEHVEPREVAPRPALPAARRASACFCPCATTAAAHKACSP